MEKIGTPSTKDEIQKQYRVVQAVSKQIQHEEYRIQQQEKHLQGLWVRYHEEQKRLTEMVYG